MGLFIVVSLAAALFSNEMAKAHPDKVVANNPVLVDYPNGNDDAGE